uniref:Zinc finger Ran-binding domain-containing protein 2 n=1 Tax=Rhodnius prolixus TaxID=13249 RepID=R4FL79_RHOPR
MDSTGNRFKMSDGDWVCCDPHCANINFARRNKCNRCHKDRTDGAGKKKLGQEIGKALADKSRGLFSADDWQCNKCGNVNWARRQQCNMCNAPKFGEIEERTGYGGGYNDRGVVEYIKRDDSDSEYDEFGRRKRKTKNTESDSTGNEECSPKTKDANPDNGDKSDDEEDGEEEDGDDDLSKYDLSGWGDDSESVKQTHRDLINRETYSQNKRRSPSTSRSRSRSPSRSPSQKN